MSQNGFNNSPNKAVLFMATILSKMSQLFSEINYIYLNSMMNGKSIDIAHQFQLFQQIQTDLLKNQNHNKSQHIQEKEVKNQIKEGKEKQFELQKQKLREKEKEKQRQKEKEKEKKLREKLKQKEKDMQKSKQIKSQIIKAPPNPPPSSFLLFFKDHKQKISQEYPQSSIAQLSKIASECWKQLSPEEKKIYHDKFNEQKIKYYEAMKLYNKQKQKQEKANQRQSSLKKRGRKPKLQKKTESQAVQQSKKSLQDSDDSEIKI